MSQRVVMLKTLTAYDDVTGERKIGEYKEGGIYTVGDSLFNDLVNAGAVDLAVDLADDVPPVELREMKIVIIPEPKQTMKLSKKKS